MSLPLVVVGASLGGVEALKTVFSALPADFPAAVAAVQHRRADSDSGLELLLQRHCKLPVVQVEDKDPVEPGRIYLAPPDYHLLVDDDHFALDVSAPVSWARPSIDVLFESAAEGGRGRRLVAVLLTASSEDGALGMAAVARAGGVTIVQDPEEALSDVAIRAAMARMRADYVVKLAAIARTLAAVVPRR